MYAKDPTPEHVFALAAGFAVLDDQDGEKAMRRRRHQRRKVKRECEQ